MSANAEFLSFRNTSSLDGLLKLLVAEQMTTNRYLAALLEANDIPVPAPATPPRTSWLGKVKK